MNFFKALRRFGLFAGLITIVVGVLFLLFSKQVAEILAMIVGIGILAIGVIRLIQALRMSPEEGKGTKSGEVKGTGLMERREKTGRVPPERRSISQ